MGNKDAAKTNYGKLFRALGDEHRLHILRLLAECEMNAQELLVSCDIVQSTLSHHMKTLQEGSLVRVRRDGKWTYYTLNTDALEMAKQYLDELRVDAASAQKKAEERQGDQPAAAVAGENAEPSASTKAEKAAEPFAAAEAGKTAEPSAAAEAEKTAERSAAAEAGKTAERSAPAETEKAAEAEKSAESHKIAEKTESGNSKEDKAVLYPRFEDDKEKQKGKASGKGHGRQKNTEKADKDKTVKDKPSTVKDKSSRDKDKAKDKKKDKKKKHGKK